MTRLFVVTLPSSRIVQMIITSFNHCCWFIHTASQVSMLFHSFSISLLLLLHLTDEKIKNYSTFLSCSNFKDQFYFIIFKQDSMKLFKYSYLPVHYSIRPILLFYYLFKEVWSCDCFTCNIKPNIDDNKLKKYRQWAIQIQWNSN